jgi:hypothetical protein
MSIFDRQQLLNKSRLKSRIERPTSRDELWALINVSLDDMRERG